jgi:hypothetical protein
MAEPRRIDISNWDNSWLRQLRASAAAGRLCARGCGEPRGRTSRYVAGHDARGFRRVGCVYAFQAPDGGPVMLGQDANPAQRLRQEERWPGELRIVWSCLVDDVTQAERALHAHFAAQRIHPNAEWFDLPEVDSAVLNGVLLGCLRNGSDQEN